MKRSRSFIILALVALLLTRASVACASTILQSAQAGVWNEPSAVFSREDALSFLDQQPDIQYGRPEELRGVTRVFIYTDLQIGERENIIRNLRKKLPHIIFSDTPQDADVYLVFRLVRKTVLSGIHGTAQVEEREKKAGEDTSTSTTISTNTTRVYKDIVHGHGLVFKKRGPHAVGLLMEFGDQKGSFLERRPSTNFARAFAKAFRSANR
ncbi:MAG TPA: hypothetical protein VFH31_18895 [Pyrinomonadaceae bacterium]|nr:hypothetical protein [Pyrinomonadaceae bacterium]